MHISTLGRRVAAMTALAILGACSSDGSKAPVAPVLPSTPAIPAQYRGAAFLMDVSATKKTVRITAPSASISSKINPNVLGGGAQYSLLGGDVIELVTSNFQAGAVGAVEPGKVAITFDLQVLNKLAGLRLTTPTFPTPPSGVTGVQVFPFEISVTTTSGGVASSGNEVVVTSPRFGAVVPSSDWGNLPLGDGNFHNFFNDVGCTSTSNDCFRYEPYAPIDPQGASAAQKVGFIIDPTVGDFRVKMIVAADLQSATPAQPGTVAGTVTSNIGAINGATISVTGGFSGNSNASGAYSISGVTSGQNKTVSISNLPSGCTANQGSFSGQTVPASGTLTVNFAVTCQVPTGQIAGTVTKQEDGSALTGVTVVVTPQGGAALAAVQTAAGGAYIRSLVPTIPSNGTITLSGLPANCINAGPYSYTGLTTAGLTRNIVVSCPAPAFYPVTASWAVTGTGATRKAELTLAIDMDFYNDPAINGTSADDLSGITFQVLFDGTKLAAPTVASQFVTKLSPAEFDLAVPGNAGAGTASASSTVAVGSTSAATKTGNFQIIKLSYNIGATVTGTTLTPTVNVTEALATSALVPITSKIRINGAAASGAQTVQLIIP